MIVTRAQYAAWFEAHEASGAEVTELAFRQACNAHADQDDTTSDPSERDVVMDQDEALAVLRHMPWNETERVAFDQVEGELIRLRTQRRDALDLAAKLEHQAWENGGDHAAQVAVRRLREVLGAPR